MRASKLLPFLLVAAIPAAFALHGCGSSAPSNTGGKGGDEETGGSTGTGGSKATGGTGGSKATGGSGGATGGSGGATGGSGGATGGSGGATGGSGGATGGSGGATGGAGGATGGAGGAGTGACGMGRTKPASATIDNFDGQKLVVEWKRADKLNPQGTAIMPTGSMKIMVTGTETHAAGYLAPWAAKDRPCLDGSAYNGIQFNASGDVTSLIFRIGTPATYPVVEGGICTDPNSCYAHWQKIVTPNLGTAVIKVPFAELTAPFGTPAAFEKSALISIIFLTLDTNTAHSFTIDNISFY